MASTIPAELLSTQEQLADIVTAVTRVQDRLTDIARRSEDEARTKQERLEELESSLRDSERELTGLWEINQDLQEAASEPKHKELERALEAKETITRKLRHAMDALGNILVDLGADDEGLPLSTKTKGKQRAGNDDPRASREARPRESNKSNSSGETVRPSPRKAGSSQPGLDLLRSFLKGKAEQGDPGSADTRSSGSSDRKSTASTQLDGGGDTRSLGETIKASTESSSSSGDTQWNIRYSQRPKAAACSAGPMVWTNLADRLGFNDKQMAQLTRFATFGKIGMRLKIWHDNELAFVYDAIKFEGPSGTYLIDWGHKGDRAHTEGYVTKGGRPEDPVFHTFLYEVKSEAWYYIGATTWSIHKMWEVWPTLSIKSKAKLAAKLSDRTVGVRARKDISKAMDQGMLEQVCFRIDGSQHLPASREYMKSIGYNSKGESLEGWQERRGT